MTNHAATPPSSRRFSRAVRGTVALLFATMIIPLLLMIGIAIDFSFYIRASAELNLAADAAAMHAVRAMSLASANGTTYQNAGMLAGYQWFAAQAEPVLGVTLTGPGTPIAVTVNVNYTSPTYTATVTYNGTVNTMFGRLAGVTTWPISGTATATISNNFVDVAMLLDASQSMWIGATASDIATLEAATPCAVVTTVNGVTPGDVLVYPDYVYNTPGYGYQAGQTLPPLNTVIGYCDPNYLPGCLYPPNKVYGITGTYKTNNYFYLATANNATGDKVGACNNGGGRPGAAGPHTPASPCALACHQVSNGQDWFTMAQSLPNLTTGKNVQLRFNLVQSASQQVIQSMIKYSPTPQTLLGVGIYTFGDSFQPIYPCATTAGCTSPFGTDLNTAQSDLSPCTGTQTTGCYSPPVTPQAVASTNFANAFTQAASFLSGSAGDGSTPAKAKKNLFIVTDGADDVTYNGSQFVGPIDQILANPCQQIKNQGITIYVLYTPYLPNAAATYADNVFPASPNGLYPASTLQAFATINNPNTYPNYNPNYPTDTPIAAALRACASKPSYFYMASSSSDITNAMQQMLASALNSAARVTN